MGGINASRSVEGQDYVVTTFGRMVDRYALSFENDGRYQEHKKYDGEKPLEFENKDMDWRGMK